MAPKVTAPEWMKRLKEGLATANLLPAFEEEFPFPWQEASEVIAKALQIPEMQISLVQKATENRALFCRAWAIKSL